MKYIKLFEEEYNNDELLELGHFLNSFINQFTECRMKYYEESYINFGRVVLVYEYDNYSREITIMDDHIRKFIFFKMKMLYMGGGPNDDIQNFILHYSNNGHKYGDLHYSEIEEFEKNMTKENFEFFTQANKYNL
jgi:hypothetical protein